MTRYIGILGGGNISETHLRAAMEVDRLKVAAVWSFNREKGRRLGELAGGVPVYEELSDFLSHRPMDLVAVGSPSGLHAEHGIAAARAGLHVIVEKPIDITVKKADQLIEICRDAGVRLAVFFQDRVSPEIRRLKRLIDSGFLGKPLLLSAHVRWYRPPEYYADSKWRGTWALDGGGALMNQGIHTVDLVLWLLGPVTRVTARTATLLHRIETEDTAVAVLEFRNGALGVLEAATSAFPGLPRRVVVTGSEGTAILEHHGLVSVETKGELPDEETTTDSNLNESASSPVVSDVRGHQRILEDFLEAITRGTTPVCDGPEGRRSVELVEAIYRSGASGLPVELGD